MRAIPLRFSWRPLWGAAISAALTLPWACSSFTPQPVEPYTPVEESTAPASATAVASATPTVPTPRASASSAQEGQSSGCTKLLALVRANSDTFKEASSKDLLSKNSKAFVAPLASAVKDTDSQIQGLELSNARLKDWAQQYHSLLVELSKAIESLEQPPRKPDPAAAKQAASEIKKALSREAELAEKIGSFCSE